jgi:hypothetical protein
MGIAAETTRVPANTKVPSFLFIIFFLPSFLRFYFARAMPEGKKKVSYRNYRI